MGRTVFQLHEGNASSHKPEVSLIQTFSTVKSYSASLFSEFFVIFVTTLSKSYASKDLLKTICILSNVIFIGLVFYPYLYFKEKLLNILLVCPLSSLH